MYTHNTWEHLNKYSNLNSSTTYKTSRKLANYHLRTKLDMSLISKCDPICRIITWCFYIHWQFLWTFKNKTHIQNWHDRRSCDYRNTFGTAYLNNCAKHRNKEVYLLIISTQHLKCHITSKTVYLIYYLQSTFLRSLRLCSSYYYMEHLRTESHLIAFKLWKTRCLMDYSQKHTCL